MMHLFCTRLVVTGFLKPKEASFRDPRHVHFVLLLLQFLMSICYSFLIK